MGPDVFGRSLGIQHQKLELLRNCYRHILPSVPCFLINIIEFFWLRSLCLCLECMVTSLRDSQRPFLWHWESQGARNFSLHYLSEQLSYLLILLVTFLQAQFDCFSINNYVVTKAGSMGPTLGLILCSAILEFSISNKKPQIFILRWACNLYNGFNCNQLQSAFTSVILFDPHN